MPTKKSLFNKFIELRRTNAILFWIIIIITLGTIFIILGILALLGALIELVEGQKTRVTIARQQLAAAQETLDIERREFAAASAQAILAGQQLDAILRAEARQQETERLFRERLQEE